MKNKFLALLEAFAEHSYWQSYSDMLAALLLSVSLLPAQALAASDPDPVEPPVITEPEEPGDPENPIVPYSAPSHEDPGLPETDH